MKHNALPLAKSVVLNGKILIAIISSVFITTLVVGVMSYFVFRNSSQDINGSNSTQIRSSISTAPLGSNQPSEYKNSDIVNDFIESSYRVVSVLRNPYAPYSLIIATERSKAQCGNKNAPSRCLDDSTCGSIYTSPNCYFFLEPQYVADVDASTRFIGEWHGGFDGLNNDSVKFIDQNNVRFISTGCDAGASVKVTWNLNLKSGKITQIKRQ